MANQRMTPQNLAPEPVEYTPKMSDTLPTIPNVLNRLYDKELTIAESVEILQRLMAAERLKIYNDLYPISDNPGISEYIMERIVELTHQAQAGGEEEG